MFLEKGKPHRILLLCLGIITVVFGVMVYAVPPTADPDPSWGFEVMKCMERGGGFNLNSSPDPNNIAKTTSEFLAWWSPGQYLMPYFFKVLLKVNTGHALALTIGLCNLLGIAGFYKLFTRLGFTQWLAAISIAVMMVQQFFILPYIFYTGGEVLLFAFMGWFLYGCFGFKKITWHLFAFIFAAGLIGFFAKSSVLWMYAAGVGCIWINLSADSKKIWLWLRNGALLAIPMIAAVTIIYVFYLSKGGNPSDATGAGYKVLPETFTYPLAAPLLAGFSLDELFNGLIYHPDGPMFSYPIMIGIIVLIAIGSLVFIFLVVKYIPNKDYTLVMLMFYVVSTLFFSDMYFKQAAISYEGRHFRMVGLLAIPGVVYLINKTNFTRALLVIICIAFIKWNFHYFKVEYQADSVRPHGTSGLSQQYDKTTVDELIRLDNAHPNNAIFVMTNPDIALEINNNRIITLDIDDMPKEDFAATKYEGKAGTIYMLMPTMYVKNGQAQGVANWFKAYHNFKVKPLSKEYYLYSAEN